MRLFEEKLDRHDLDLRRGALETLQINLGRKCNQACRHCHVDAAPWRTEMMTLPIARRIGEWITRFRPPVIDLTGGAPEINDPFYYFVELAGALGLRVIDRNNLTIIEESGYENLPEYLAFYQVEIIASLPCYSSANVNQQRGHGVFEKSITALQKLNAVGYGHRLPLHLVYNPLGPTLPAPQNELEADYKEALYRDFGIVFHRLLTLANQPIARFAEDLRRRQQMDEYLALLARSFNPATVENVMCRTTLSVGFQGDIFDCDFNQMLGMQMRNGKPLYLWDITPEDLPAWKIQTGNHCLACTAGAGSSCSGALLG